MDSKPPIMRTVIQFKKKKKLGIVTFRWHFHRTLFHPQTSTHINIKKKISSNFKNEKPQVYDSSFLMSPEMLIHVALE